MENTETGLKPISLEPRPEGTVVAAVDTSTVKIGETSKGILVAVRGATIWKKRKNYRYLRLGPFIFHIMEENRKKVHETLRKKYFGYSGGHGSSASLTQMPTRIAALLERWLQAALSGTLSNGLILFDGSLTSGMAESSTRHLKEILNSARNNGNTVLAFSKGTGLRFNGYVITDIMLGYEPPYIINVTGLKPKPPIVLLGDVYVARLTKGNCAFRLDVDKEVTVTRKIEAVEKLLGNDIISQSYPETLRLAHIFCTFTANEVIAMKHFIARKYDLKIINRPDMHKLLFGPFGKGENRS